MQNNKLKNNRQITNRMVLIAKELATYEDAIIKMTDEKGKIEFAIAQGEQAAKLAIAKNLLLAGSSITDIVKITELTHEEVTHLKEQTKNKI